MKPFHQYFDHTLLRPEATRSQIIDLCREAAAYEFAAVCVNGCYVKEAAACLQDTPVKVATVVGFPLGAMSREAKLAETELALADGADEIDMVMHIGAAKDGRWADIEDEIRAMAALCHCSPARKSGGPACLKVILEICLLTDQELEHAAEAALAAGADFIKTSTGFSTGGATADAVRRMRAIAGEAMQVKAAGGIRTLADARAMIDAGADRLGCSASVSIMQELARG